ncbi:MAG: aspartate aminotransferase family protein, partial [Verrucomicrobiia bacterium]
MRRLFERALDKARIEATFQQIGSMFCLYFTGDPVHSLEDALRSDRERFKRFFHGCLERGVYFAPSPFEAGFLSLAHTEEVLDRTARVVENVLGSL